MSWQPTAGQSLTPIYQCDSNVHDMLREHQHRLHQLCHSHMNRLVKIETVDGDVFEGHIVHCDRGILYICLSNEGYNRAFSSFANPYYNRVILPLVLFNLLAIALL